MGTCLCSSNPKPSSRARPFRVWASASWTPLFRTRSGFPAGLSGLESAESEFFEGAGETAGTPGNPVGIYHRIGIQKRFT